MAPQKIALTTLPQEVLHEILQNLTSRLDLHSLLLMAKKIYHIAKPLLYSAFEIEYTPEKAAKNLQKLETFTSAVLQASKLLSHMRKFVIKFTRQSSAFNYEHEGELTIRLFQQLSIQDVPMQDITLEARCFFKPSFSLGTSNTLRKLTVSTSELPSVIACLYNSALAVEEFTAMSKEVSIFHTIQRNMELVSLESHPHFTPLTLADFTANSVFQFIASAKNLQSLHVDICLQESTTMLMSPPSLTSLTIGNLVRNSLLVNLLRSTTISQLKIDNALFFLHQPSPQLIASAARVRRLTLTPTSNYIDKLEAVPALFEGGFLSGLDCYGSNSIAYSSLLIPFLRQQFSKSKSPLVRSRNFNT